MGLLQLLPSLQRCTIQRRQICTIDQRPCPCQLLQSCPCWPQLLRWKRCKSCTHTLQWRQPSALSLKAVQAEAAVDEDMVAKKLEAAVANITLVSLTSI